MKFRQIYFDDFMKDKNYFYNSIADNSFTKSTKRKT